jgi:hypothetical protein
MYRASREVGVDVQPGRRMTVQFRFHAGTKDGKLDEEDGLEYMECAACWYGVGG